MGRPANRLVRENFIRSEDAKRLNPVGICKHCGWRRVFNSTNMQTHLEGCQQYKSFVASGRSAYELERQVAKAMADPNSVFNKPRKERRPAEKQKHEPSMNSSDRSEREKALEAALGVVWNAFASAGSADTQPNGALWNLVRTVAPDIISIPPNLNAKMPDLLSQHFDAVPRKRMSVHGQKNPPHDIPQTFFSTINSSAK